MKNNRDPKKKPYREDLLVDDNELNNTQEQEVEEATTTGNVAGYNIPGAFTHSEYDNLNKKLPKGYKLIREATSNFNVKVIDDYTLEFTEKSTKKKFLAKYEKNQWVLSTNKGKNNIKGRSVADILSKLMDLSTNGDLKESIINNSNIKLNKSDKFTIKMALKERKNFKPKNNIENIIKEEVGLFLQSKQINEAITPADELKLRMLIRDELAVIFFDLFRKRSTWT